MRPPSVAPEPPATAAGPSPVAWQPFTFQGVASFAQASSGRTLVVALVMALAMAWCGVRVFNATWFPVIELAVNRLPAQGEIRHGRLSWSGLKPVTLADNAFLALVVNPDTHTRAGQSADLQIEFQPQALALSSLFGYVALPYPSGWVVPLNRPEVEPLWGAWRPYVRFGLPAVVCAGFLLLWTLLATLLVAPLRLYVSMVRRRVSLGGCWRLGLMALMPGALLMNGALALYTHHRLILVELLLANAAHLVLDLVFLALAPLRLPRAIEPSPLAAPVETRAPRPPALPAQKAPAAAPSDLPAPADAAADAPAPPPPATDYPPPR